LVHFTGRVGAILKRWLQMAGFQAMLQFVEQRIYAG